MGRLVNWCWLEGGGSIGSGLTGTSSWMSSSSSGAKMLSRLEEAAQVCFTGWVGLDL